jgi:hypothetical protein
VEGLLLTILGAEGPVVPRRFALALAPGPGALHVALRPPPDAAWSASVGNGWRAALRLAGRAMDATLTVAATGPLRGGSAGLPVGLVALAALLEEPLPPFFATGGVVDGDGFLAGGLSAEAKARAAASLLPGLGWRKGPFVTPPLPRAPAAQGLEPLRATDLGSAFAGLAPRAYHRVAAAHRRLREVPGPEGAGRFALVHGPPGPLPAEAAGIALRAAPPSPLGPLLGLGEDHVLRWRTPLPPASALAEEVPRLWALARACAAP